MKYSKLAVYAISCPLGSVLVFLVFACVFPRLLAWTIESFFTFLAAIGSRLSKIEVIDESKTGFLVSLRQLLHRLIRLKYIKVDKVYLLPSWKIEGFSLEINSSRTNPQIVLSWKSLQIKVHWASLLKSFLIRPSERLTSKSPKDYTNSPIMNDKCSSFRTELSSPESSMFRAPSFKSSGYNDDSPTKASNQKPTSIVRPIEIIFIDFHLECLGLRFKDFVGPSSSLKPEDELPVARKMKPYLYLMKSLAFLVKMQFLSSFDFDFIMTAHKSKIVGSCSKLTMYVLPSCGINSDECLVFAVDMKDGALEIYQNGVSAMEYFGQLAQVRLDVHLPSGMQAVKMNLFGKDEAAVSIPSFLEFYQEYQNAEDDAIESKLARHLNVTGKMYDIYMHLVHMKVSMSDPRSASICVLELDDMMMQMETFMLTNSNHRYIRGLHRIVPKVSDISPSFDGLSPNIQKVLTISVSEMRWPAYDTALNLMNPSTAFVKKAHMKKTLIVINEGDFVDDENMIMSADVVEFHRVSLKFLEWLIIMQETANAVPTSRFAHPKKSVMLGKNQSFAFSTTPAEIGSSLDDTAERDDLVVVYSSLAEMTRTVLPRQSVSTVIGKAEQLQVHSSLHLADLSSKFNVRSSPSEDKNQSNVRTGILWTMPGFNGSMTIGEKTQLHRINMSYGLTIQLTAQTINQHVAKHIEKSSSQSNNSMPLLDNTRKMRHSFTFANEKPINPLNSSTVQTTLMQSSVFNAIWSNDDITTELGDVEMNISMGAMIKLQLSFRMILDMNRRVLRHMTRIKSMSRKGEKTAVPPPVVSIDPISIAIMRRMHVVLSVGDSSPPEYYPNTEIVPLSVDMVMDDVEMLQSTKRQSYKWRRGEFLFNHWKEQPAFIHKDFFYESVVSADDIRRLTVKMKEFIIGMSTLNHFGETMEAINTHYDAYKLATKPPIVQSLDTSKYQSLSSLPSELLRTEQNKLQNDPYILDLQFDTWIISMDGPYAGSYRRNFVEMRYDGMIVRLDCSLKELDLYSNIAHLDYGFDRESESFITHSNATGGLLDLQVKAYTIRCSGLDTYSFRMKNYTVSGEMYSASVEDLRVAVKSMFTQLADPKSFTVNGDNFDSAMYVLMKKSSAPLKIYFNLDVNCEECVTNIHLLTTTYADAFEYAMKWCSPPNRDQSLFNSPLLWWDSMRYWLHGCYSIRMNTYRLSYALPPPTAIAKSKMTLLFNITKLQLIIEKSSVELSCNDVDIDLEIVDQSRYVRRSITTLSPLNKILRLPGLIFSLSHTRTGSSASTSGINHHDVYLHPCALEYPNDAYALFRSQPKTIKWQMELACLDTPENPITIHARLDILTLLVQAMQLSPIDDGGNDSHPSSPVGVVNSPTSEDDQPQLQSNLVIAATIVQQHYESSMTKVAVSLALPDILQSINLQIHVHKLMFHSWVSNISFSGIVFSLQRLDLQLLMNRETSSTNETLNPLAVENMYFLLEFAELYVREWCVKDNCLDVIPSPMQASSYFDPQSSPSSTVDEKNRPLNGRPFRLSRTNATVLESLLVAVQEPLKQKEVQELMKSVYKLAHASKVEMTLTENGEISREGCNEIGVIPFYRSQNTSIRRSEDQAANTKGRIALFRITTSSGEITMLLGSENRRMEDPSYVFMKERIKQMYIRYRVLSSYRVLTSSNVSSSPTSSIIRSKKPQRASVKSTKTHRGISSGAFRPMLSNFLSNHAALMPPYYALPLSYQGNRPRSQTSPRAPSSPKVYVRRLLSRTSSTSEKISKIWGLRVIDIRLLWTLEIRDTIFAYVSQTFDVYRSPKDQSLPLPSETIIEEAAPVSEASGATTKAKAILTDFRRITKIDDSQSTLSDLRSIAAQDSGPLNKVRTKSRSRRLSGSKRMSKGSKSEAVPVPIDPDLSKFVHDNNSTKFVTFEDPELIRPKLQSPGETMPSTKSIYSTTPPSLYPTPNRPSGSADDMSPLLSNGSMKSIHVISPAAPDPLRERKLERGRSVTGNRASLIDRNSSMSEDLTRSPESRSYSPIARSTSSSTVADPYQNPNASVLHHRSFVVELIELQINFLDTTSHSSMVIVTGRSQFEGYLGDIAFLPRDRNDNNLDHSETFATPQRKSELKLSMDGVSAYTAPSLIGVGDIDQVHWRVMDNTITDMSLASPSYLGRRRSIALNASSIPESPLRVVIQDFQIRAQYAFWNDVLASEARSMTVILSPDELLCAFTLDLPEIIVDTDSSQFYITLNVIRNLLLVPPPPLPNLSAQLSPQVQVAADLSRYEKIFERHGIKLTNPLPHVDINNRGVREVIKSLIEEDSTIRQVMEMSMARIVQVYIGKGVWLLRGSSTSSGSSSTMIVETGFTGVFATFTYHEDRSASVFFETQRFWARNESSSMNGSSSSATTGIVTPRKHLPKDSSSWIVKPVLLESEPCVRCGAIFQMESNNASSCAFHADEDGFPGKYIDTVVYDELTQQPIKTPMWTCCGRSQADAPGCNSRPHICKEIMISIRAETNPLIRIHNLDVQIVHALDISFFPGAFYDFHVELSRHVIDMLHNFFSIEMQADNGDLTSATSSTSNGVGIPVPSTPAASSSIASTSLSVQTNHQELLYVNYLRLGDINVDVSTTGFPLNIENYRAVVEPFICRGEVLNWHRLIANMERHTIISVTKNFASNIGNRIGNIFLGSKPSTRGSYAFPSSTPTTAGSVSAQESSSIASRFMMIRKSITDSLLRPSTVPEEEDEEVINMRKRNLLLGNQRRGSNASKKA